MKVLKNYEKAIDLADIDTIDGKKNKIIEINQEIKGLLEERDELEREIELISEEMESDDAK